MSCSSTATSSFGRLTEAGPLLHVTVAPQAEQPPPPSPMIGAALPLRHLELIVADRRALCSAKVESTTPRKRAPARVLVDTFHPKAAVFDEAVTTAPPSRHKGPSCAEPAVVRPWPRLPTDECRQVDEADGACTCAQHRRCRRTG